MRFSHYILYYLWW